MDPGRKGPIRTTERALGGHRLGRVFAYAIARAGALDAQDRLIELLSRIFADADPAQVIELAALMTPSPRELIERR